MSEIKVNSIKGVAASTAALTINNTDGTCTANLTNRTNKNLILNGAMQVAQRGTSSTSGGYQTVDKFAVDYSGVDESPTQAQVDVASGTTPYTEGFRKAFKITNGNQTSGAGASDYIAFRQNIEAQNLATSGWNYNSTSSSVTLSFWIKSSVAQSFKFMMKTEDGSNYIYHMDTGSLSADTWTKVSKTIIGNSNLTINNDNGIGVQIYITAYSGTTYTDNSVTENAWQVYSSGILFGKDNTSTWYTTDNATLEITGVQLEVSGHATDFEHRSFSQELALCQRYYFRIPYQGVCNSGGSHISVGIETGSQSRQCVIFPRPMRALPSCAASNLYSDDEQSVTSANTVSLVYGSVTEPDRARVAFSGGSYTSGQVATLVTNGTSNTYLEGSAEI